VAVLDDWSSLPAETRQAIRVAAIDRLSETLTRLNERLLAAVDEVDYQHLRKQREKTQAAIAAARRLP
jgi:hypothetical protein